MAGRLSIVASPIGNLEDITFRAIRTLKECDVILAEDTRTTIGLLKHYQIPQKEILSFFEGNEDMRSDLVLRLLAEGKHVVLVSESGTPLIADPGYKLVRAIAMSGGTVESIPGPTSFVSALVVSGLPTNAFLFLGFLPKKEAHARKLLSQTRDASRGVDQLKTVVFYESPYRLVKSLKLVKEVFGEIEIVVSRELTKIHEEIRRENVSKAIEHFEKVKPRGEFTVVLQSVSD